MSGGHFDFVQYRIDQAADEVANYIARCEEAPSDPADENSWDPEYSPQTMEKFRQCEATLRLAAAMLNRVDWLVSEDDGEESFHERWDKDVRQIKKGDA